MAGIWRSGIRAGLAALSLAGGGASGTSALACETALLLAVDVSNSIDPGEYRIQTDGMAEALRDDVVVEAMVRGLNAIAVMQWSGVGMQEMTIPWQRVGSRADMERIAAEVAAMRRAFVGANTAIGEAVRTGVAETSRMSRAQSTARGGLPSGAASR